ncbi:MULTISPECIES: beta-propeller domain-containing protein [unclassified Haladaptatus]|uniref:beta-propeller domain-containing protein n=1 Tax=unclassified Haladaptatus TaxID=2622732 RepID=UPI0023E8100C|nr:MULTISPECIES: beta-propeller domain-containing protein [unclassified Haladaptatus]
MVRLTPFRIVTLTLVVLTTTGVLVGAMLPALDDRPGTDPNSTPEPTALERFDSAEAFQQYLEAGRAKSSYGGFGFGGADGGVDVAVQEGASPDGAPTRTSEGGNDGGQSGEPDRVSGTNVQIQGIDEPDLVKTDGTHLFVSQGQYYYYYYERAEDDARYKPQTSVVSALPPEKADVVSKIDASGELLLANDTLLVLGGDRVTAYDVSDPDNPEKSWEKAVDGYIHTARLMNGTVYLVVQQNINYGEPCPIEPLAGVSVRCTDILHPSEPMPSSLTYTALALEPDSGEVSDSLSFVGGYASVVTMSETGIYLTYSEYPSQGDLMLDFLLTDARDLLDQRTVERLERLQTYDLSEQARTVEVQAILQQWYATLSPAERERVSERLQDRAENYVEKHKRDFVTTSIVKVGIEDGFDVTATGAVPGTPFNQFSMDEHEGHLRIATTIWSPWFLGASTEPVNDVYVLDESLSVTGSVEDMGKNERIFGVRFDGDRGYVVTFRQIDPFHVLDLSDPQNPTLEGELKLPGFSSYLHPIGEDRVLGIGQDNGSVKAVMFDVSDPTDPTIEDDLKLDDRWSAIQQSHHAFLLDEKHGVFFLPGAEKGHIVAYDDGLEIVTSVKIDTPQRAVYIGDHLYVIGQSEIVVLDETTWDEVNRIDLR